MKRFYFCFNFWKKNIAALANKKFGKGSFKPSKHMLYLIFFSRPTMEGCIIRHSLSIFCPGFLISHVRIPAFGWMWSKMCVTF